MNKFLFTKTHRSIAFLLAVMLVQACGGERTAPYNPVTSSSSSSGAKVTTSIISQGTATAVALDYSDKSLQVMRNENDFYGISNGYVNVNLPPPNFTNGQVVLLDLGAQDSCKQRLDFNSIRAEEAGVESVKVIISYRERTATPTGCTSALTRPFYFYYVESRGTLIVEEIFVN